jgi:hypothetical protein
MQFAERFPNLAATIKLMFINILVFIALFTLAELLARFVYCKDSLRCEDAIYVRSYPGQYEDKKVPWMKHDPDLGWVLDRATNLLEDKHRHHKFKYNVNSEGFRNAVDFSLLSPYTTKTRIMLLGDSFVFGLYVEEEDTLSSILDSKLGEDYDVFNLGISGWGIDQMLLAYQKYTDVIKPEIVILTYIDNDIRRAMEAYRRYEGVNKPSFEIRHDRLVPKSRSEPPLLEKLSHKSLIFNKLYGRFYIETEMTRLTQAIFSELIRKTAERDQRLIVLRYPLRASFEGNGRGAHYDYSNFFQEKSIDYLDPYEAILALPKDFYKGFYLEFNAHPAKRGNEFMADYIINKTFLSKYSGKLSTAIEN